MLDKVHREFRDGCNELITAYGLTVVKCLKIVDFELKKLAGRYMELRDGRLRAVNGWLYMVRTLEMAGFCLLAKDCD